MLSCVSWAQGDRWDGRWGVVVCSNDQVALIGLPLSSASAAAVLVGRGAPLQMGDAGARALAQPHFVSWLGMAPLPAGEPLQELHKGHAMRATVHVGSRGEACRWSANRAVERVSADQTSFSQPSPALFRTPRLTLWLLRTLASLCICFEPSPHSPTDGCTLCTRSFLSAARVSWKHFTSSKTSHCHCGCKHGRC